MFAVLHSDINSHKSGLLYLTSQPYCKKSRSAKVKDGIINLFLWNYLVDRYTEVQGGVDVYPIVKLITEIKLSLRPNLPFPFSPFPTLLT